MRALIISSIYTSKLDKWISRWMMNCWLNISMVSELTVFTDPAVWSHWSWWSVFSHWHAPHCSTLPWSQSDDNTGWPGVTELEQGRMGACHCLWPDTTSTDPALLQQLTLDGENVVKIFSTMTIPFNFSLIDISLIVACKYQERIEDQRWLD